MSAAAKNYFGVPVYERKQRDKEVKEVARVEYQNNDDKLEVESVASDWD